MLRTSGFLVAALVVVLSIIACGGSDKPPLTPDDTSGAMPDAGDLSAPAAPADTTAAPAAPTK